MKEHAEVWVMPGRQFGRACVSGHRIPTETVAEYAWHGEDIDSIQRSYDVTRAEILCACWFEQEYGHSRTRRKAWRAWSDEHFAAMWRGEYGGVPLPPARQARSVTRSRVTAGSCIADPDRA